eukprot:COSAG01_NODE_5511_length_4210_cov_69.237898_5_plen_67_part_00
MEVRGKIPQDTALCDTPNRCGTKRVTLDNPKTLNSKTLVAITEPKMKNMFVGKCPVDTAYYLLIFE